MSTGQHQDAVLQDAVLRIFAAGWNSGNFAALDELLTPDCRHYGPDGETTFSNDEYKALIARYRAGFPDFYVTVDELVVVNDLTVFRLTVTGTQTGELRHPVAGRIAPTGKRVRFTGIGWLRFVDGKLAEHRATVDWLGMLVQLGAIPAAAPAGA